MQNGYWRNHYESYYKPYARRVTARRHAQKKNAERIEDVDPEIIAKRDNFICHLCDGLVEMDQKFPESKSPSMDHVQPLSLGGDHTYDNIKLAHLGCNIAKGNRNWPKAA